MTTTSRWVLGVALTVMAMTGQAAVSAAGTGAEGAATVAAADSAAAGRQVVLYYFHTTRRCGTCQSIERYAQNAVEMNFEDELEAGSLRWTVLNTDEPENAHFIKDFQLVSSSLVVVELSEGKVVRHDILEDAWTLVRDEPRFVEYVRKSVGEYLE